MPMITVNPSDCNRIELHTKDLYRLTYGGKGTLADPNALLGQSQGDTKFDVAFSTCFGECSSWIHLVVHVT